MTKQKEIELVLKKLYWQGRNNADLPITDISVRSEIEELIKLGVVIKVKDRELKAGETYTAYLVEPLIGK